MDYLKELCKDLNLDPNLEKSEGGGSLLQLTDSIGVEVKLLEPGVRLFSPIGLCPEIKREELFILLMKANLFGQGTLGAVIAYDEEQNLLTLSSEMPYDMKYRAFKEAIEDFVNITMYWREEVDRHKEMAEGGIL